MTDATIQSLNGLRDFSTIKWYIIPLLAIICLIYAKEINKAREHRDWNPVFAALTVFGLDFFNETWNGWVLAITGRSAVWTAPGDTAFRVTVGWNIEIIFMFLIAGFIYYYMLSKNKDKKFLKINEKWWVALILTGVCVAVECILNYGGQLIWEYALWNRTWAGIWTLFIFGYFIFFAGAATIISFKKTKSKLIMLGVIYAVPIIMNIISLIVGWVY